VLRFFDLWGGAWGARPDVMRRAGPATVELCEEIWSREGKVDVIIDIVFDEFHLSVDVSWAAQASDQNGADIDRLIGHLRRRYDCTARLQLDGAAFRMRFNFVH